METYTIRQIRLMNEKTQEEFAKLLNITPIAYRNKEVGETRFYFDEVKKIAETFNVDLNAII